MASKKGYGDTLVAINSPEFVDRLAEIKGSDSGITWSTVADKLNDEFSLDLAPNRVSDLYKKNVSTEITVNRVAKKKLDAFVDSIAKRFESISNSTDQYHKLVNRTLKALEECEDAELLERIGDVLKAGKQVETTNKMIMNQIELVRDEQDKISVTQKNNVYSAEQVKASVYKQLTQSLKILEGQGKIQIRDPKILEC